MGKSCIRFEQLEDLPLDVIGRSIGATPMKDYVAFAKATTGKEATAARREARSKPAPATAKKPATTAATKKKKKKAAAPPKKTRAR